jgi:hypothetical protein
MKTVSTDPCKAIAQTPWLYPSEYPQYNPYLSSLQMPPPGLTTDVEYQMRQMGMHQIQQVLMHQMMQQMTQLQQMQMINQLQHPQQQPQLQQSHKKTDKNHKKDHRIEISKVCPSPQVSSDDDDHDGDEGELGKSAILGAVNSLYEDRIMPYHMLVLRRLQEMYGHRWSSQKLSHVCSTIPEIHMVGDGKPQRCNILLTKPPEGFTEFVDQSAQDDTFSPELWEEVEEFLCAEAQAETSASKGWPGSRYEFAKWLRGCLPSLGAYSLGHICHLVQLCISKKELLGYYQGNLVPYQLSDDCRKKSNAKLLRPTQIQPGELYVQSWEHAGDLLARLVEQNNGTVQVSSLKALFRKVFKMELSESAFGHAKLSEFLQDPRLRSRNGGFFTLEEHGMRKQIVLKECTTPVEPAVSASVEQVSPADWHAPPQGISLVGSCPDSVHPPPGLVAPPGLDWP